LIGAGQARVTPTESMRRGKVTYQEDDEGNGY